MGRDLLLRAPAVRTNSAAQVLQFRVGLEEIQPAIWRRILVPERFTLLQLHRVLQMVLGWHDSHLHEFEIGGKRFGEPDPSYPDDLVDEHGVRLRSFDLHVGSVIRYQYDFGDNWQHELRLEAIIALVLDSTYPLCIAGARSAPPEDVGGTGGYADFLEAITDPEHEDHDSNLVWAGGKFDPEAFSLADINQRLRGAFRQKRVPSSR